MPIALAVEAKGERIRKSRRIPAAVEVREVMVAEMHLVADVDAEAAFEETRDLFPARHDGQRGIVHRREKDHAVEEMLPCVGNDGIQVRQRHPCFGKAETNCLQGEEVRMLDAVQPFILDGCDNLSIAEDDGRGIVLGEAG
ncbi:MAG TPA: hypothetical protein VMQ73_05015 [Methylomirabilota bacterium]|nr:hypothetical protein [Methylomirabilota bacterium]